MRVIAWALCATSLYVFNYTVLLLILLLAETSELGRVEGGVDGRKDSDGEIIKSMLPLLLASSKDPKIKYISKLLID